MYGEPLQENLVDEVTRLVGRPRSVVREAIARMLTVMVGESGPHASGSLCDYPLTAWTSIAPDHEGARMVWTAVVSAGLTTEEVYTALAVVDDHVRRRFGSNAWHSVLDWGHRLARQYEIEVPCRESRQWHYGAPGAGSLA